MPSTSRSRIPAQTLVARTLIGMKLSRRSSPEPEVTPVEDTGLSAGGKGRPTPKRRDVAPKRQPMSAPRTTKEANRQRKEQTAQAKRSPNSVKPNAINQKLSTREFRQRMREGDESVLPKRDKGPVRKLARDWVDTHFMISNFLLLTFPLLLFAGAIPNRLGTYVTIAAFVAFALEWVLTGQRIHALAVKRFGKVTDKPWVLGLYAGQRAFMPRRWRVPGSSLRHGDPF
jgi:hypothetical protein